MSRFAIFAGSAMLTVACTPATQQYTAIDSARTAIRSAATDPNVLKYAQVELQAALDELAVAEDALKQHRPDDASQPAYLATQTARLAQVRAATKADDARVAAERAELDRIRLASHDSGPRHAATPRIQSKEQAARLQAEIDALNATPTSRGLVLTLGDVLFDPSRAKLTPEAVHKLDQLAQFLREHHDRLVQVDGFTDSVGDTRFNQDLSQRRADAVKDALLSRGVDGSRIATVGYGKAFPVAVNADWSGRHLNRRVEVVIGGEANASIAPRS